MLDLQTGEMPREKQREKAIEPFASAEANHAAHRDYLANTFNVKLYNRDSDLLVIYEAAKLFVSSESPEYAISSILRMMSQMLGLNRGRVLLPEDGKLCIRYSYGLTEEERRRGIYLFGEGITGKVMQCGHVVVIENIDQEPGLLFRAVKRATLPQETVSYIALPIMDGARVIGVLACHRIRGRMRAFDEDLLILRTFATFISQILKINNLLESHHQFLCAEQNPAKQQAFRKEILGTSPAVKTAIEQVEQVANTNATVLLSGESGTGKESFARLIHELSERSDQPFVAINCAAIPEQLLESELFGHERGAFTGAVAKKAGKFELANQGTLFLDEIGDLDATLQTKLLRILETQCIQRVGGVKEISVDVRVVVATHKNLMQAVNDGLFRLDLFYRLNVFPLHLPPLRYRSGDTPILARHFLSAAEREYKRHAVFETGVLERLASYQWPGNIRQLENVVKRAVLLSKHGKIPASLINTILARESQVNTLCSQSPLPGAAADSLADTAAGNVAPQTFVPEAQANSPTGGGPYDNYDATRRCYNWVDGDEADSIRQALKQAKGNKTRAAAILGMSVRQFRYRLKKLAIID
ncbi:MAG: sigma 54-interacting transcriptional regulator [Cellvibrionaceae bacterium]|nr:sigma 54-interacting transcriptional regulator [Cellvibrionaceae bacterium]